MESGSLITQYKIISPIGKGGMGEVYLAQDTKLNRKVAIKFLNEEISRDSEKLNRFVQEAQATSALNHPNILTIFEIGEKYFEFDDDPVTRAYLALAKAKTGNRDEAVKQLNWLKQEASKRYISSIAFGIIYLALGEKEEAYKWLEKEVDDRSGWANWYSFAAALDELRDEPRFKAMLKRLNLPE